jgi:hypothetical protein
METKILKVGKLGKLSMKKKFEQRMPVMQKEYERNLYGLRVKKCCASCAFKDETRSASKRKCTMLGTAVRPCNCCKKWKMDSLLLRAGKGVKGEVKRFEYLMYVLKEREAMLVEPDEGSALDSEDMLGTENVTVEVKSIAEIRATFEQEHGSIYIKNNQ